ncbi:PaaX family transcriptional regulator [Rhodococcoides fascians A21d2]|uniref:PaaX family transcriptional regulator n=1 Tax=Rhodococcoides fascians TaxID=1828 RepID=UPI0005644146|nr:PaaX family transcriptional regulator C-terminal domain-containing protein [Rhodococcus fascians]QII00284.1 PaaX family transcriptional regulator [Rhodococcus fascians A21d2]
MVDFDGSDVLGEADSGDGAADLTDRSLPPRSLIVTVVGLYVREFGGWVSVSSLIRLMEPVGVDAPAVRSAVSRLKRRGILVAEKRGTTAGYALSAVARDILAIGDRRIFGRPAAVDEDWTMVVFSVPESERRNRHALRTRLAGLGFGNVTSGVWIAPTHLAADCATALAADGLGAYADIFAGARLESADLAVRVSQWWDLDALGAGYAQFFTQFEVLRETWNEASPAKDPGEAFADYIRVLTAWRRLPYRDPGLPAHLLPRSWPGERAATLFADLRALLEKPAHTYVDRV